MTLSYNLRLYEPEEHMPDIDLSEALARATEAARDSGGGPRWEPWRFYVLGPETAAAAAWLAARRLEAEVGLESARAAYEQWRAVPGWIAITCQRYEDSAQMERAREATLTAAQRASLSLWSDNIPSNWVPTLVSDEAPFYELIGGDSNREIALGVLLYGHPERGGDVLVLP
jgi:hypothetical protein